MSNNKFPETTLQPLQTLDFVLGSGKRVRTMLLPMPDSGRKWIADVEIKVTNAGCTTLQDIKSRGKPLNITTAAAKAYEYARTEANRVSSEIIEVQLEGEEFLWKTDVEVMVSQAIRVKVV